MKHAKEWLNAVAFVGGNPGIELERLIQKIQDDARKDGLMTAQAIASDVIRRKSSKYARPGDRPPASMALSGLAFFVCAAITSEADKLNYARFEIARPT